MDESPLPTNKLMLTKKKPSDVDENDIIFGSLMFATAWSKTSLWDQWPQTFASAQATMVDVKKRTQYDIVLTFELPS